MPLEWNPQTGQYDYIDPNEQSVEPTATATAPRIDFQTPVAEQLESQRVMEQEKPQDFGLLDQFKPDPTKPVIAQNPGQAFSEVWNITANAGTALATDYLDLAAMVGDTFVQSGNLLTGQGWDWNEWGNDEDNPWTQARLNTFEPETQVGEIARPIVRGGVMLLSLPKLALKGITMPLKAATKIPRIGGIANKGLKAIDKAQDAYRGATAVGGVTDEVVSSLTRLSVTAPAGSKAAKLASNASRTPWLYGTYDDIGRAIAKGEKLEGIQGWFKGVNTNLAALASGYKNMGSKLRARTIGEALAWDAFVAFNMAGEGNREIDEGFANWAAESGIPGLSAIAAPFATSLDDTAIAIKAKSMFENTLIGGMMNVGFDVWRAWRFAKNFQNASPAFQRELLQRFASVSQDIGDGVGQVVMGSPGKVGAVRLGVEEIAEGVGSARRADDLRAKNRLYQQLDEFQASKPGGELSTGKEFSTKPVEIVDMGPRPPEPVVTPQTIREAVMETLRRNQDLLMEEGTDGVFREIENSVKQLMPRNRVDALEYLTENPPMRNQFMVENSVDSIWRNYLYRQGMKEGWVTIDANTMQVQLRRAVALEMDRAELGRRAAQAADDQLAYEEFLSTRATTQGGVAETLDSPAQRRLGQMEAADAGQQSLMEQAAEAGAKADAFEAAEDLRLSEADARSNGGELDDVQVVREMIGENLNELAGPEVRKVEGSRRWEVVSPDGTVIGGAPTKKAAQKLADKELRGLQNAMASRARQLRADGTPQGVPTGGGRTVTSSLTGKVKLTPSQLKELRSFPAFVDLFGADAKTFDLSFDDLGRLSEGMSVALNSAKGTRKQVLRNLIDRFDVARQALEPEARQAMQVDRMSREAQSLAQKGEICDYI